MDSYPRQRNVFSKSPSDLKPSSGTASSSPNSNSAFSYAVSSTVWICIFIFRLTISTMLLSTADVPDEWWQSTEVAYYVVHGKGELTWEWHEGIRSFMYPLPYILMFKGLTALGLDSAWSYWFFPKLFTSCVAFGIDYLTYTLAHRMFGRVVGKMALLLSVIHGYTGFLTTRTLSNVVEGLVLLAALVPTTPESVDERTEDEEEAMMESDDDVDLSVAASLRYQRLSYRPPTFWKFLLLCGLGCSLRITFVLPVLVPALAYFHSFLKFYSPSWIGASFRFATLGCCFAVGWILLIASVDRMFYGYWVVTPLKFIAFNVFEGLSALFGTHPWHWYLSQGLPAMIGGHVLLFPSTFRAIRTVFYFGKQKEPPPRHTDGTSPSSLDDETEALAATCRRDILPIRSLLQIIFITVVGYSLLAHKEFRFLYPIIPLVIILLAYGAVMASNNAYVAATTTTGGKGYEDVRSRKRKRKFFWLVLFILNAIFFFVFAVMFQRGTLDAVFYVRDHTKYMTTTDMTSRSSFASLHVLAGCHQTPGYSYLHKHITSLVLTDCTIEMQKKKIREKEKGDGGKHREEKIRLPTEHHLFEWDPLSFVQWVYEGKVPKNETIAKHLQRIGRRAAWWKKEEGEKEEGKRGKDEEENPLPFYPPDRILIYTNARKKVQELFLEKYNFVLEKQFYHTFHPLEEMMDYTIELWKVDRTRVAKSKDR